MLAKNFLKTHNLGFPQESTALSVEVLLHMLEHVVGAA